MRCFLCNRKRGNVSLHRFPKNPSIKSDWLAFCKLDETVDDVSSVQICSAHFLPSDYVEPRAKVLGTKMILKPNSVPSILKPRKAISSILNSNQVISIDEIEIESHTTHESSSKELNTHVTQVPTCSTQNEAQINIKQRGLQLILAEESPSKESNIDFTQMPTCSTHNEGEAIQIKRASKFLEPRYIGDIKTTDFATPNRAAVSLNFVKRKIYEQARKIHTLQQDRRRLIKRFQNLEELIPHIHNRKFISENNAESMEMFAEKNLPTTIVSCRTCLNLLDFNSCTYLKEKLSFGKTIEEVICLFIPEMVQSDLVTDFICSECTDSILRFTTFIQKIITVENQLKKTILEKEEEEKIGNLKKSLGTQLLNSLSTDPVTSRHAETREMKDGQSGPRTASSPKTFSPKIGTRIITVESQQKRTNHNETEEGEIIENVKKSLGTQLLNSLSGSVDSVTSLHAKTQEIKDGQSGTRTASSLKTYPPKIGSRIITVENQQQRTNRNETEEGRKIGNFKESDGTKLLKILSTEPATLMPHAKTQEIKTVINYGFLESEAHSANDENECNVSKVILEDDVIILEDEDNNLEIETEDLTSYDLEENEIDMEQNSLIPTFYLEKHSADNSVLTNHESTSHSLWLNKLLDNGDFVKTLNDPALPTNVNQDHNRVLSISKSNEEVIHMLNRLSENEVTLIKQAALKESGSKRILLLGTALVRCTVCKGLFSSHFRMKEHFRVSHGNRTCPSGAEYKFRDVVAFPTLPKDKHKPCPVCGKNFIATKLLEYHIRNAHKDYYHYKCQRCGKRFKANSHYVTHLKNYVKYKDCRVRKCVVCKETVVKDKYRAHMEAHKTFKCNKCQWKFVSAKLLNNHLLSHEKSAANKKPKIYEKKLCNVCGKLMSDQYMRYHMRTHAPNRKHLCDRCPKVFTSLSGLRKHINVIHNELQSYECSLCKKKLKHKESLKFHMRLKHSETYNHNCHICGAGFIREDYYRRHMKHHIIGDDRDPGVRGGRKVYIKLDEKGRNYSCKYCHRKYQTVHLLRLHLLNSHLKNKPRRKCRYCELTFKNVLCRSRHEKRHRDPEAFELTCQICWKKFSDKGELQVHCMKHESSQKYTCDVCGEAFSRRYLLDHHVGEQHFNEEELAQRRFKLLEDGLKDYKVFL